MFCDILMNVRIVVIHFKYRNAFCVIRNGTIMDSGIAHEGVFTALEIQYVLNGKI